MGQSSSSLSLATRRVICERVVIDGWSVTEAAAAAGCSRQTASRWVTRFRLEGLDGLLDRSRRPSRIRFSKPSLVRRVLSLRRRRRWGPHRIGWLLGIARSTVYAILRRAGMHRLERIQPREPIVRYEHAHPGALLHLDTKKLGRIRGIGKRFAGQGPQSARNQGIGWDVVHVAIDDHSRVSYVEVLDDECADTTTAFAWRAIQWFEQHGIGIQRILTDNGSPYRSREFADLIDQLAIRHLTTRPYRPQTNGKAEAMIKLLINEWAYARPYASSAERTRALSRYLDFYNHQRHHGGINGQRPIDRLTVNDVPGKNS
jgi:transposase InsO family protein